MKFKSLYSLGIAAFLPFFLPGFFSGKINPTPAAAPAVSCEQYISAVRVEQGMLAFTDWNHYNQVLNCLNQRYEAYHDSLNTVYAGLTDEQYSDLEDRIGIDDDKPLKDFEARFKFNSLRAVIESRIVTWLQNDRLDWSNDPDDEPIMDEVERTLLNPNYMVKIGRDVVNMNDEATDGDGSVAGRGAPCQNRGKISQPFEINREEGGKIKEYRVKLKIKFNDISNGAKTKAKVVHLKRRSNGSWKRYKTKMTLSYDILLRDSGCRLTAPFLATTQPQKAKKLVLKPPPHISGFPGHVKPFENEYCGKVLVHDANETRVLCF